MELCYNVCHMIRISQYRLRQNGKQKGAHSVEWVIIVDDMVKNLELAGRLLTENGIRVTTLESGAALLALLETAEPLPDLILLDMNMPEMDGFETLNRLKKPDSGFARIPVIFLSSDKKQEREAMGLQLGAIDCIRKPLEPDILVSRVKRALCTHEKLVKLEKEAMTDSMTGFLNKNTAEDRIRDVCRTATGLLCVLDLDSFKLFNDLFGHDMGDRVLILFADLLKHNMRSDDICGRIGGDEFLVFARNMRTESELVHFTQRINDDYLSMLMALLGDQLKFSVGVSIGAASVPAHGREFGRLFHLADQALNEAKKKGKHCCVLKGSEEITQTSPAGALTLDSVTMILEERNVSSNAMWMGRDAFINIYRYMNRYLERYHGVAYRALLTINILPQITDKQARADIVMQFRSIMQQSLRNSDVMVEVSENQIFLLLPQMHEDSIDVVMDRLMGRWEQTEFYGLAAITWETGKVHLNEHEAPWEKAQNAQKEAERETLLGTVQALANAIDARCRMPGHSRRVADIARKIAEKCGYDEKRCGDLFLMALVHDAGMIEVPDAITGKPGALTDAEYETVKAHAAAGVRILETVSAMPTLAVGARGHHERCDGAGYPDGLAGDAIPEEARIIAVADAYDAMRSGRPYRAALTAAEIRAELEKGAGGQFDPRFAKIMTELMDEADGQTEIK